MNRSSPSPSPRPHPVSDSLEVGIVVVLRKEIPILLAECMAAGGAAIPNYSRLAPPLLIGTSFFLSGIGLIHFILGKAIQENHDEWNQAIHQGYGDGSQQTSGRRGLLGRGRW